MKRTDTTKIRAGKEKILQASALTNGQARCLVSNYYMAQELRKRGDMQLRHLGDKEDPNVMLDYFADAQADVEKDISSALMAFAQSKAVGRWMLAQHGIGPVITAGLLAHIDIEKAPTYGHIWRFAGLDPSSKWLKGQKRPWNAELKQICWHAGQCFKRISYNDDAFYGRIYRSHKAKVVERNNSGEYAERAKTFVTRSADVKKTLEKGKLPDGNLDSQACRYAVKMFLSHLHGVMFWDTYGTAPPKPFAISILGHAHEVKIPNLEMFPGLEKAYYGSPPEARVA